jgi:catechol 2,3-dioxygenase-like lactoylglutathione lyase family enzyme
MSIRGAVQHTGFTVSNLERSVDFYVRILGCKVIMTQEKTGGYLAAIVGYPNASIKMAHLRDPAGHHVIELFEYLVPEMVKTNLEPRLIGNAHLCFLVSDLNAIYDAIKDEGITFVSGPVDVDTGANAGGAGLYLKDPDGIIMEIFQPSPGTDAYKLLQSEK